MCQRLLTATCTLQGCKSAEAQCLVAACCSDDWLLCRLPEQPRLLQHPCQLRRQAVATHMSSQNLALLQQQQQNAMHPAQVQDTKSLVAVSTLEVGVMTTPSDRLSLMMTGKKSLTMRMTSSVSVHTSLNLHQIACGPCTLCS